VCVNSRTLSGGVAGIDEDKVEVKALVKDALSRPNIGSWLLIVDNADDIGLLFGPIGLADWLLFSTKGSILCIARTCKAAVKLVGENIITVDAMDLDDVCRQRSSPRDNRRRTGGIIRIIAQYSIVPCRGMEQRGSRHAAISDVG
jgi:hypothetical protein